MTTERRILDELVYGRVRSTVNLCQLVIIEQELEENIQRAMAPGEEAMGPAVGGDAGELAREYVQRAWERLVREWSALREDLARAECPRCVHGMGCADGACDAP
jgi:hypothetical protein